MEKKCPCYVEGKITEKRMDMSKALFITGTGTDIGKTYVTGLIVKKLAEEGKSAAYYKAAMSGNDRRADGSLIPGDALFVQKISGITQPLEEMCPYPDQVQLTVKDSAHTDSGCRQICRS